MRREWIEMGKTADFDRRSESPSMRREWIEMDSPEIQINGLTVSLHAEGVD